MRRGEVWAYRGLLGRHCRSTRRLVVSSDLLNESDDVATCYALHVLDTDPDRFSRSRPPGGGRRCCSSTARRGRYQPDQEGTQLLLRLPGLATNRDSSEGDLENRVFVDRELASVAFGLDFAECVKNPYDSRHPLTSAATWTSAASELSIDVAARQLEGSANKSSVLAVADRRQDERQFDAVLADLVALADAIDPDDPQVRNYLVDGVLYESLRPGEFREVLGGTHLKNCVIEHLTSRPPRLWKRCPP